MRNFLDLGAVGEDTVRELVDLAGRLERTPEPAALAGRVLGLVFLNPSLRTLASFQAGMARLGGSSFVIAPGSSWGLEYRTGVPTRLLCGPSRGARIWTKTWPSPCSRRPRRCAPCL